MLKHKLVQTMGPRDARDPLCGRVEVYDAYLGGKRAVSSNGGRRVANKPAFVAAMHITADGRPLYMRLTPVTDFTNKDMQQWPGGRWHRAAWW